MRIKKGNEWKAAFKTNKGLFEPMVMFFSLCNSPATFQAMMNDYFRDYLDEGWVVIYIWMTSLYSRKIMMNIKKGPGKSFNVSKNTIFI